MSLPCVHILLYKLRQFLAVALDFSISYCTFVNKISSRPMMIRSNKIFPYHDQNIPIWPIGWGPKVKNCLINYNTGSNWVNTIESQGKKFDARQMMQMKVVESG